MRLRLLKVAVQVHAVVEDDDGNLTEQVCEPVMIPAREWPAYRAEGGAFDQAWSSLAAQIEAPPAPPTD